jgi:hypothetical protein
VKKQTIFLYLLLVSLLFPTCKKGEDDPLFSIRTRTNRISGDWELNSAKWQFNDTITEFESGNLIRKVKDIAIDTVEYLYKMSFLKDGSYTINIESKFKQSHFYSGSPEFTLFVEEKGKWSFTGGYGDTKKGEYLLKVMETRTESFSNQGSNLSVINKVNPIEAELYYIKELRFEKLVIGYNEESQHPDGLYIKSAEMSFTKL